MHMYWSGSGGYIARPSSAKGVYCLQHKRPHAGETSGFGYWLRVNVCIWYRSHVFHGFVLMAIWDRQDSLQLRSGCGHNQNFPALYTQHLYFIGPTNFWSLDTPLHRDLKVLIIFCSLILIRHDQWWSSFRLIPCSHWPRVRPTLKT